jgi:hypothetical protein
MVTRRPAASRQRTVRSWDRLAVALVQSGVGWAVHSVFRSAFNLRSADGSLLAIVAEPAGNGPATLVLAAVVGAPSFETLLTSGAPAHVANGWLMVGDELALDLRSAALWRPAPIRRTLPAHQIAARLSRVAQVATAEAPAGGLAPLLRDAALQVSASPGVDASRRDATEGSEGRAATDDGGCGFLFGSGGSSVGDRRADAPRAVRASGTTDLVADAARAHLERLASAIREGCWSVAQAAARALSGLGPGLTPAGDDALVGLALGLRAGLGTVPAPLDAALSAAVEGRTTDLAAARVRHAAAGHADESVQRLLTTLVGGSDERLDEDVRAILAIGHSSGADTLVGLLVGLALGTSLAHDARP